MTEFEFVFPLFALLIGLSVAEMLSGLAHALKSKRDIHVGWMTPLLGTLILINLAMFWQGSWEIRHGITTSNASLLLVLVVGAAYFLAASMVFPSWGSDVRDLDEHFMDNRKVALVAIAACNLVFFVRVALIDGPADRLLVVGRQRPVPGASPPRRSGAWPPDHPLGTMGPDRRARCPAGDRLTWAENPPRAAACAARSAIG